MRDKTCDSPYARGFFALLEALEIIEVSSSTTEEKTPVTRQ